MKIQRKWRRFIAVGEELAEGAEIYDVGEEVAEGAEIYGNKSRYGGRSRV